MATSAPESPLFDFSASLTPPVARLAACGELDLCAAVPLSEALGQALADGCRDVRVDLGLVRFIDASCLDVFVMAHRRLVADGGSLLFVAASSCVRRVFGLTGLSALLEPIVVSGSQPTLRIAT